MQCCTQKKRGKSMPHGAVDNDIALAGGPDDPKNGKGNGADGEEGGRARQPRSSSASCCGNIFKSKAKRAQALSPEASENSDQKS